VTDDHQIRVRIVVQALCEVAQILCSRRLDAVGVVVEEQPRVEGDLDALADALDLGARDLLIDLLRLLVHLVADNAARDPAEHGTDDRATRGAAGLAADDPAHGRACARADDGAALLVAQRLTAREQRPAACGHEKSERNR
jgi:hypothetical protein